MRRFACSLALLASLTAGAHAQVLSPDALGFESAAAIDDARALRINPAAIGLRYPYEARLAFATSTLDRKRDAGSATITWRGVGAFGERTRFVSRSYGAGFAAGPDRLRMGWSAAVLAPDGNGGASVGDHAIGVLSRPLPWLSAGAVLKHVTAPTFRGNRLAREQTFAVGLRPLALSRTAAHEAGTRWTLTADVTRREGEPAKSARVRVGTELEPISGLVVRATAERGGYRVGLGIHGTRMSVHAAQQRADDVRTVESYAWSMHQGEEATRFLLSRQHRVAVVRVAGTLADESLGGVSLLGGGSITPSGPLHRQLERALGDPLTRGVLLDLQGASGMAQLEELRARLLKLRAAGKPVVAYLEYGGGRGDLFLASAAKQVVASQEAFFGALGLRAERRYYKQFLADQGVRLERSSVGQYKSAYRNFSVGSTPPADSVVIQHLLDQQQRMFVKDLSDARRLKPAALTRFLDGRPWRAVDLAQGGVIDSVGYREDAMRLLGRLSSLGERPRLIRLLQAPSARRTWTEPERIAIVYASGGIEVGRSGSDLLSGGFMGSQTIVEQLERAFHSPGVKAVVLRVESPGGSTLASDLIDHAVQRLRRETGKPLIVSMGSVAASGGYYISCHADRIYADRSTRTGSIGVLFVKPSFEGFYAKHRIRQEDFDRGEYMRSWSYARDWTPREQAIADSSILRSYAAFVGKVAEGRGMRTEAVNTLAQGRVWLGEDAAANRLIDGIGGLDAAIAEARRRGGIPEQERIRLLEFRRPRGSFVDRLLGGYLRGLASREARTPDFMQIQARENEALESLSD
ncbi:MAG: signal peptide peptidase SppA [Candidatus Eisenbacteria bacterium]